MNPGYQSFFDWALPRPSNQTRSLAVAGHFPDATPNPNGPYAQDGNQPHGAHFPPGQDIYTHPEIYSHGLPQFQPQAVPAPLIPLSAVQDLRDLQPPGPLPEHTFDDPLNRDFAANGPAVFEGFIPAFGELDELVDEDDVNLPRNHRDFFDGRAEWDYEDEIEELYKERQADDEEEETLRKLDEMNEEIDADYSEEEAQHDEGDPNEMDLDVAFEDMDPPNRPRRSKYAARNSISAKDAPNTEGLSTGRRGRPSGRGRGGHHGAASMRGKKTGKRGRPKGTRGPRAVADPGNEFRELQRQANEKFIAKDYPAALECAQKAIQVNPEIFDTHNITSEIYAAMGDDELSIEALIVGAPTKRDPGLWHTIIDRINKLDVQKYPKYTDEVKTASVLACLNEVIKLDNNYDARSHKLEIEARLGHSSRCIALGMKMLKNRREEGKDPDTDVLKIMAMMGTINSKQTRIHLERLIYCFEEAIGKLIENNRDPLTSALDWEMINIYADLMDRSGDYDKALRSVKKLSRWKQGRCIETYWDEQQNDCEFDLSDEPRRINVFEFSRGLEDVSNGRLLPIEIRVKLGIFRLRRSTEDFAEAMRHLELMEPDNHDPDAIIWDYEDLFRITADALHGAGHDKCALRFYEPLFEKRSPELTLMSHVGIHTSYTNIGEVDKAKEVVPILQKWTAETYDELAVLAKFFEDQGMHQEAAQRAERIYRDKYGHKLKRLGFKAYDELRAYYFNQRKQARGRYAVKKSTVERNRKTMLKATAQDGDNEVSADENVDKNVSLPASTTERPTEGLFRTKKSKVAKAQIFLPSETTFDAPLSIQLERTTLESTEVPVQAIDDRFFRKKLETLSTTHAEDLLAARAQHREIVRSFAQLEEITEAAEDGEEEATSTFISIARELIQEFSTFELFYTTRKEDFTTYFRRVSNGDIWKDSALMVLAVATNAIEDGSDTLELKERPDIIPSTFWGISFTQWLDTFGRYALVLAHSGDATQCFAALDIALQSNIFHRSQPFHQQLQLTRLACALAVDSSLQASTASRWLMKTHPFSSSLFRLYSASNRLCSASSGFATGAAYKAIMRYIRTSDYALLSPTQRTRLNLSSHGPHSASMTSSALSRVCAHDPALFAVFGYILMAGGSYLAALNYFFRAYAVTPHDPVVCLCIGACYVQHAMKRGCENRQYQICQGLSFVGRYYEERMGQGEGAQRDEAGGGSHREAWLLLRKQEAEYNVGRMWHALGITHLAIPAYERCIALSERVRKEAEEQKRVDGREEETWACEDFAKEAAFAMQNIYMISGNYTAAKKVTDEVLIIE